MKYVETEILSIVETIVIILKQAVRQKINFLLKQLIGCIINIDDGIVHYVKRAHQPRAEF